ncbi:MAG: hypothetical protein HYZ26_10485 [Chloroflexi bacterium]|nr:hypothetical protein [Chloroflexota bacterium]
MNKPEAFEALVSRAARNLVYPPTPTFDLTVSQHSPRMAFLRPAIALAALALALLAVPPVRARLFDILRLGGVRILLEPGEGQETQQPFEPVDLLSGQSLSGRTTLAAARQDAPFAIPLPAYPAGLEEPAAVYLQDIGTGPFVILVWPSVEDAQRVGFVLYILGPGTEISKGPLEAVQHTLVGGEAAIWTEGLYLVDVQGFHQPVRLVEGGALIWTLGDLTLRLEGAGSLEEAVRIAESIR